MNLPIIRAIFFDAAGTLIHLRESVGTGYARVARRHGFLLYPAQTDEAFRRIWKSMPPMGSPLGASEDRSEKSWWRWLVEQLLDEVAPCGCDDRDAFFEDLFAEYAKPDLWRVFPEVNEVLDALSDSGQRLFVLSNFDARLLPVLEGLGLSRYFENIFYSGEIGHAKPSPEIFQHALDQIDLPAATCLHVGDDPVADWRGARAADIEALELDRSKRDLRALFDLPNLPDFSD